MALPVWEKATGVAEDALPGTVALRHAGRLTAGFWLVFAVVLWPQWGLAGVLMGLVFARMAAVDLTMFVLPNVYTWPLMAMGLVHGLMQGTVLVIVGIWAALAGVAWLARWLWPGRGVGGGDWALGAAMVAFLGPVGACVAVAVGVLLWLPVAFARPQAMVPLGVPLIVGWVVVLCCPHLPEWLELAIT